MSELQRMGDRRSIGRSSTFRVGRHHRAADLGNDCAAGYCPLAWRQGRKAHRQWRLIVVDRYPQWPGASSVSTDGKCAAIPIGIVAPRRRTRAVVGNPCLVAYSARHLFVRYTNHATCRYNSVRSNIDRKRGRWQSAHLTAPLDTCHSGSTCSI